jgi:O-antigen/teichoic acid export membrane protein
VNTSAPTARFQNEISRSTIKTIARNFLALIAGEALSRGIGLVIALRLARVLGVEGFGALEVGLVVLVYLQIFVDGGLDVVATREVARRPELRSQYAGNLIGLRLVTATLAIGVVLAINVFTSQPPLLDAVVLRYALSVLPAACALGWAFQASERMRAVAAGNVIQQLVYLVGVELTVVNGHGTVLVPIAYTVATAVGACAVAVWYVRRYGWIYPRLEPRFCEEVVREALPVAGSRGLRSISFNFDILILGYLFTQSTVGLYAAAYRILTLPLLGYATLFTALFPTLVRLSVRERRRFVGLGMVVIGVSALAVAAMLWWFAESLLTLLMGPPFAGGASALRVLAWSIPLTAAAGVSRQALIAAGRQRIDLVVVACGAAVNVTLNLLLIPAFGFVGAATATVSAEGVVLVGSLAAFLLTQPRSGEIAGGLDLPEVPR